MSPPVVNAGIVADIARVSLRYGRTTALEDITLQLPAGCMVGLIGPDGVGKSSLLALIAGVRLIQSGSVNVLGLDLSSRHSRTRLCPRIAYMPQGLGRNLYPTLSIRENVDFFGRLFGYNQTQRQARIAELLASTGLTPFADRPAAKLSGGMKQKLALCCALIHDPDLLILDEPTTGVDPLSRRQFWQLIRRIRDRRPGMSVVVSTAYLEEAVSFDWLVAMDGGRVLATGQPPEFLARTATTSLESAFIALMNPEKRQIRRALEISPRSPRHGSSPAIVAEGLTKRFGDFTAVDNVSFHIERGEIYGFLGSNGCGKTTTMKMLTGLLPASEGEARLFGQPAKTPDLETRKRVGYMSQSFSLYTELTVIQNLELHARLFHLPDIPQRLAEILSRFELGAYLEVLASELPLGIRQRLSLAVAVIHEPEMLILDEPTSGVDPVGRDQFWELLLYLAREKGVTIFISTHFMNEAARCDRIALMHAGRVLASDTPAALIKAKGCATLEETFIAYLEEVSPPASGPENASASALEEAAPTWHMAGGFSLRRLFAYLVRETLEIRRDPIRLAFALLGPVLLMLVLGYGITFDVEDMPYAVLDHDQTTSSREYLENYSGSRYFLTHAPLNNHAELDRRLQSGELKLAVEIPPNFASDLKRGRKPEIAVWIDGAMPFRGETMRGYVQGLHQLYLAGLIRQNSTSGSSAFPVKLQFRYRYNQDFKSINAMVPCVIALLLMFMPSVSMALGVVREKELGTITNLYATPVTRLEFLLGKQIPYIGIGMLNFFTLFGMAVFLFGVPFKTGLFTLILGALLYVTTSTGMGLLMSSFTKTQLAALFGTAILTVMPAVQFSGMITPVSSLTGGAALIGQYYPSTYFMRISVGTFTKALGYDELSACLLALAAFIPLLTLASWLLLKKQEK